MRGVRAHEVLELTPAEVSTIGSNRGSPSATSAAAPARRFGTRVRRYPGSVRVIGGDLRGRRLHVPAGSAVRPTSDRVREAIFDVLFSLGGIEGRQVADLFCGTGAMGIEALSRGAAAVTFVDADPTAITSVRDNLVGVGLGEAERSGEVTCTRAEVADWAARTAARYDVVFCDPPYDYEHWPRLVEVLPADLAVLESRQVIELPMGWEMLRSKRYGSTIVTVARPERVSEKGRS